MSQRIGNNQGASIGSVFSAVLGGSLAVINTGSNLALATEALSRVALQKAVNFEDVSKLTDEANLVVLKAEISLQLDALKASSSDAVKLKLSQLNLD
jgi:hypothetical protein